MTGLRAFALTAALALFLAGCTSPGGAPPSATGASTGPTSAGVVLHQGSYTLTIKQFAGRASPEISQEDNFTWPEIKHGTNFTFMETIDGSAAFTSDHVGGHFGRDADPKAPPSTTVYPVACDHQGGRLPGTYTITCHAPAQTGTYRLRGHARITQASGTLDWWSGPIAFRVV